MRHACATMCRPKRVVLLSLYIFISLTTYLVDAEGGKLQRFTGQQEQQQMTAAHTEAGHATAFINSGVISKHKHSTLAKHRRISKGDVARPCPAGCEQNGNCNKELGSCECAVGYSGANCSQPLWPSCKLHPQQKEMYCGTWYPKSCACFKECAKHICPNGPQSCERSYDLHTVKCFERPVNFTMNFGGEVWDGGSSLPTEEEVGVKYYRGLPGTKHGSINVWKKISRAEFVNLEPDDLLAVPLRECRVNCHYNGQCVRRKTAAEQKPFCKCHYGFTGETCGDIDVDKGQQHTCWNKCQGRGACRRGFCHCQAGWWGKDCSRHKGGHGGGGGGTQQAGRRMHKLSVYAYDLPWQIAYQPEYHLGWRDHDQIYMAWKVFGEMLLNDTAVRTENPWEANLFYIPAMTFAYSSNLGDTKVHAKRVIDYVRQTWPFFNRTKGLDHFMWLTNDRGACDWPAGSQPEMANMIKVVHFGWHRQPGTALPAGWAHHEVPNKHWGCFHPVRDISAAPYWLAQAKAAIETYGSNGSQGSFDVNYIPQQHLLFFAGGIRHKYPDYSNGVRQAAHRLFGNGQHPNISIHEGHYPNYTAAIRGSKYCLAPSGHGWGIRLSQYMAQGCVPVIIQDDIYQAWEDQLPYHEFSIRIPKSSIPVLGYLLSAIPDEDYLQLRAGLAKHWRAFVWQRDAGGLAYDYMIRSLQDRMVKLHAQHYHPLQHETVSAQFRG